MRHSPKVRDALAGELALEQGVATEYAPPVDDLDAAIGEIEKMSGARSRGKWIRYSVFATIAVIVTAGIVVFAMQQGTQQPQQVAVGNDTTEGPG